MCLLASKSRPPRSCRGRALFYDPFDVAQGRRGSDHAPGTVDTVLYAPYSGSMKRIIYAHIYKGETHYVAECLDLPVVTQGKTLDEVTQNLREAVALHLEGEDLAQWDLAPEPSLMASLELEPVVNAKA